MWDNFSGIIKLGTFADIREPLTNVIAVTAVTSPWWFPTLEDISSFAALWLPILGATWLVVQIVSKTIEIYRK
jgi:hypothetical protein